jgi:thrombospondin type 3 repeat protein
MLSVAVPLTASARSRDRDRDGLANRFERKRSHTNPRKADTDRDRLKDGFEVKKSHTNPRRKDTDRDGLRDGYEVRKSKTNPRKKDTDGDGLTDGYEVKKSHTNPRKKDTDGDGVNDGDEVKNGTDPLRPDRLPGLQSPTTRTPPPLPACTQALSPSANLASAILSAVPGTVLCLPGGDYPYLNLNGVQKNNWVTIRPADGQSAAIDGAILQNVRFLRFAGLRFTDEVGVTPEGADLEFVSNNITGPGGIYLFGDYRIGKKIARVSIAWNNIHDIDYTGTQNSGYGNGITGIGDTEAVTVTDNTIKSVGGDYIQGAGLTNWVVDHNTFLGPSLVSRHPTEHQDLWQIFGGGTNVTFTNNVARNTGTHESLLFQEGMFTNVRIENNLFDHDSRGYTCQLYNAAGMVFRYNTVVGSHWGCLFRDHNGAYGTSAGSGYQVDHNVFTDTDANADVSAEARAGSWGTYDWNVSSDRSATGPNSIRNWTPRWVDSVGFLPVGLPFRAGYRP